jgi:hypothetical protein
VIEALTKINRQLVRAFMSGASYKTRVAGRPLPRRARSRSKGYLGASIAGRCRNSMPYRLTAWAGFSPACPGGGSSI